jgi:glucosamine kinase
LLLPDWQLTYLAAFEKSPGISLIIDKGVSLSYMHGGKLKKLGGWKFPVYDLGGENWLGVETIRHTIEAVEGYIPMSNLAHNVMAKFNGKIEKITETCFKGGDFDVYCLFSDILLRSYLTGDNAAKAIIEHGFHLIYRSIKKVDTILGKELKITMNGSLTDIYKVFFDKNRLITSPNNAEKTKLLADFTREFLIQHGV